MDPNAAMTIMFGLSAISDQYCQMRVDWLHGLLLPAILSGQFMLFKEKSTDSYVGFITYAHLDAQAEEIFKNRERTLNVNEWMSGTNVWIVDFVCTRHSKEIIRYVRRQLFDGVYTQWTRTKNMQIVGTRSAVGG